MCGRMRAMWPMSEMMEWPSQDLPWPTDPWPTDMLIEDFRETEPVAPQEPVTKDEGPIVCA